MSLVIEPYGFANLSIRFRSDVVQRKRTTVVLFSFIFSRFKLRTPLPLRVGKIIFVATKILLAKFLSKKYFVRVKKTPNFALSLVHI